MRVYIVREIMNGIFITMCTVLMPTQLIFSLFSPLYT